MSFDPSRDTVPIAQPSGDGNREKQMTLREYIAGIHEIALRHARREEYSHAVASETGNGWNVRAVDYPDDILDSPVKAGPGAFNQGLTYVKAGGVAVFRCVGGNWV